MRTNAFAAVVTGVVTFVLVLVELRHGAALGPDAWTYWGASASILAGDGYIDGHGLPVLGWPPLYSLWLAVVQSVTGVSVAGAIVADAIAMGFAAAMFTLWALRRTNVGDAGARWPVMVLVTAALVVQTRGFASHYVMLALLGAFLLALDGARLAATRRRAWVFLLLAVAIGAGMVLSRHIALAFVGAGAVMVLSFAGCPLHRRLIFAAAVAGSAVLTWWGVRLLLGQADSHGMFNSSSELVETAWHMLKHIGRGVGPFPVGIGVFLAVGLLVGRARPANVPAQTVREASRQADAVIFVAVALFATLAMFLLVHVADRPGDRFVGFASLMISALGVGLARHVRAPRWKWLALALMLLPPVARAAKHVALGRSGQNTVDEHGGQSFLARNATIDWTKPAGAVLDDGRVVVTPPVFSWDAKRLLRGESKRTGSNDPGRDPGSGGRGGDGRTGR